MNFLILGLSRIVRKRVFPALASLDSVEIVHLASRSGGSARETPSFAKRGNVWDDYDRALRELAPPGVVYVSLPNALHTKWAKEALESGFHVVVDKPAFLSLTEAADLERIARERGLCLAEAIVWDYHPRIDAAKRLLSERPGSPVHLSASFCFPPLEPSDFRYNSHLGGGALYDLGPYAVSCGRVFFDEDPLDIVCLICARDPRGDVETAFSVLMSYSGGCSMTGYFAMHGEYRNRISVLAPGLNMDIDRVFTPPADEKLPLPVRRSNADEQIATDSGNAFARFFSETLNAIERNDLDTPRRTLLRDAAALRRLRVSAGADEHDD